MCSAEGERVLEIADYKLGLRETYIEFYNRLVNHQKETKAMDVEITSSHLNLVSVLWLAKIHSSLPGFAANHFKEEFQAGHQLIDLVPKIASKMSHLLKKIESFESSENIDGKEIGFEQKWTQSELSGVKEEDTKGSPIRENPEGNEQIDEDVDSLMDDIKLEIDNENQIDDQEPELKQTPKRKSNNNVARKSKILTSKPRLKRIKNEAENELIYCKLCPYTSQWPKNFKFHSEKRHSLELSFCRRCRLFIGAQEYLKHQAEHRRGQIYKCTECDQAFKRKESLKGHMFREHNKGDGYACDKCEYRTFKLALLTRHISSIHDNIKSFVCSECGAAFVRKEYLQVHVKSVHDGIRYFCDQCDFRATKKTIVRVHVEKMHSGTRSFPCNQCDYKATCQLLLRNHVITVHEDVQIYPCDQCDYNARRPVLLKEHKQSKHLGIHFYCKLCDHRTTRKWHLKRHMIKIHKVDANDVGDPGQPGQQNN